jgi:hypothetical protein
LEQIELWITAKSSKPALAFSRFAPSVEGSHLMIDRSDQSSNASFIKEMQQIVAV